MPPRPRPDRRCHICEKVFGKTEHLERHIRSHTKDKPFTCNVCNKSFSRNDTLLRHWRSHGVEGPPPASSVTQARRALMPQVNRQTQNGQAQQNAQPVQQQPLPDFNPYHGYPPIDVQGMQSVQQYGQNVPDRHTEAASVLLSLPQSHPSFTSNAQDGSPEAHQNFADSLPSFPTGQAESPHMMQDFSGEALDPMLSMTAAQGEATMNANAANQMAQQYQAGQHPQAPGLHYPSFQQISQPVDLSAHLSRLHAVLGEEELGAVNALIKDFITGVEAEIKHDPEAPTKVKPEDVSQQYVPNQYWYDNTDNQDLILPPPPAYDETSNTQVMACISSFFTDYGKIFPVVHMPTFRPSQKKLLALAMFTIGRLSVPPRPTLGLTEYFKCLQKSLEIEWKWDVSTGETIDFAVIQAGLLSALFTFLSGSGENMMRVESTHAILATWAASIGPIDMQDTLKSLDREIALSDEELDQIWQTWIQKEERIRALHGLRILDAELANLYARGPSVTTDIAALPQMAPEELFSAWSSHEWLDLIQAKYPTYRNLSSSNSFDQAFEHYATRGESISRFAATTILETINASIDEARAKGSYDEVKVQELTGQLMDFYSRFCGNPQVQNNDRFRLPILWHATFINLLVDFHMLENALGKNGVEVASTFQPSGLQWANSELAQRCLTHAVLIEHYVNNIPYGREPAIHVPRALYIAGLAAMAHAEFGPSHYLDGMDGLTFPEFDLVAATLSIETPHANWGGSGRDITLRLSDRLSFVGHWGISKKFSSILQVLSSGPEFRFRAEGNNSEVKNEGVNVME